MASDAAYLSDELAPYDEPEVLTAGGGSGVGRLQKAIADRTNVTDHLTESELSQIGADVVRDWERDKSSNQEWREKAEAALNAAAQEKPEDKDYPFKGAANVRYPLLTIAGLQFAARAGPAIMKGDEPIKVKTFGRDRDGSKAARGKRVGEYLNWKLMYEVDGWEQDTDAMLHRLPSVGQHFRKVWWDPIEARPCVESVSALRLTIPADARSLKSSPRITHDFDRYPYELQRMIQAGAYRNVPLVPKGEDDQAGRIILEQHRMMDLDEDGMDEPYVVTVDHATAQVLRIDEGWDEDGVKTDEEGAVRSIERWCPFVDYGFIPDPKGRAYAIGFGHLLTPIMDVVNTTINLQLDAGHAQVAGGGFIGAEVRLSGKGQSSSLRWQPGEYKTVQATGAELRQAIFERTFPAPSPVLFQLLGMLMEAAKDIASINEAITGDAARTAPVGTTLALIEQGQQVFNAIYKRIYRGLCEEFRLFAECISRYGGDAEAKEYARFCDEAAPDPDPMMGHNGGPPMMGAEPQPEQAPQGMLANVPTPPPDPAQLFRTDFDAKDLDIRPVSDPSAVTKQQILAKDQFALTFIGKGIYADDRVVIRQALMDAGIEQAEEWIPEQPPAPPPPDKITLTKMASEAALDEAKTHKLTAGAELDGAKAAEIAHRLNNPEQPGPHEVALDEAHARLALAKAGEIAVGTIMSLAGEPGAGG